MLRLTFTPGQGVNDLIFGTEEKDLPESYGFVFSPFLSEIPLETVTYVSDSLELRVSFLEGRLVTIACSKSIFLFGMEIIGCKLRDLARPLSGYEKLRDPEEILLVEGPQHIIYVNDLGMSLWIDESDTIVSIDCDALSS